MLQVSFSGLKCGLCFWSRDLQITLSPFLTEKRRGNGDNVWSRGKALLLQVTPTICKYEQPFSMQVASKRSASFKIGLST